MTAGSVGSKLGSDCFTTIGTVTCTGTLNCPSETLYVKLAVSTSGVSQAVSRAWSLGVNLNATPPSAETVPRVGSGGVVMV